MNRLHAWVCLFLILCSFTTGCADISRKLDIALYGSEEEADAARAAHIASEATRNSKKSEKLAAEALECVRQERRKHHLYQGANDAALREVAKIRSKEIISRYSATRPNDLHSFSLYKEYERLANVRPIRELRAKGIKKPADVIRYWLSRDDDKKVLFGPRISSMEVGLTIIDSTYYWVLVSYESRP